MNGWWFFSQEERADEADEGVAWGTGEHKEFSFGYDEIFMGNPGENMQVYMSNTNKRGLDIYMPNHVREG